MMRKRPYYSDNATGTVNGTVTDEVGDDVIASIIWELEQSDNQIADTQEDQSLSLKI